MTVPRRKVHKVNKLQEVEIHAEGKNVARA